MMMNLPSIPELEHRCRALAFLESLIVPDEPWHRHYFFNQEWGDGARMASFRDGSGEEFFILFTHDGKAAIKGFDPHGVIEDASRVRQEVPGALTEEFLDEPAFSMEDISFCLWDVGQGWVRSGSGPLTMLDLLSAPASKYVEHAWHSFEETVSVEFVERVFALEPVTIDEVSIHFPSISSWNDVPDLDEIGYPHQ